MSDSRPRVPREKSPETPVERVRAAAETDVERWLVMRRALWPEREEDRHRREMRGLLGDPGTRAAFLRCNDGLPVGFIELRRTTPIQGGSDRAVCRVDGVYVAGRGPGGDAWHGLMDAAEQWARSLGCRELESAAPTGDEAMADAHRQAGFSEAGRYVAFRKALPQPAEIRIESKPSAPADAPVRWTYVDEEGARHGLLGALSGGVLTNVVIFAAGALSFYHTDIWSRDLFYGGVLPLIDAVFVIYVAAWLVLRRYRRSADETERSADLYRIEPAPRAIARPAPRTPCAEDCRPD